MNWDFLKYEYLNTSVQSYLTFVSIIVIGLLVKRFISNFFTKVIYRIYKQFWQDNAGLLFKDLLTKPLGGFVLTILFYIAFEQIQTALAKIVLIKRSAIKLEGGAKITTKLLTLQQVVDKLFLFFFVFYFIWLVSKFVDYLFLIFIQRAEQRRDKNKQQILPLLKDVMKVMIWLFGFFTILGLVFKVNVGTLIAGLGVSGIAIAFAAKESLENLMASFMLMLDKPFTIGDWIKSGDIEGTVEKVGFRSTRLRSINKSIIVVPNKKLMDGNVENLSVSGLRRVKSTVKAPVGISKEQLSKMIEDMRTAIKGLKHVVGEPRVFLDNLEDGAANISISYSISLESKEMLETVRQEANLAVYQIMNQGV